MLINIVAFCWLGLAAFEVIKGFQDADAEEWDEYEYDDEDDYRDTLDEIIEMERFVDAKYLTKIFIGIDIWNVCMEIACLYLAYQYVYADNTIYYRILFFLVCACIFLTKEFAVLRFNYRLACAIKKLIENKPDVLRRWFDINTGKHEALYLLANIARLIIALQLFLYTVVTDIMTYIW